LKIDAKDPLTWISRELFELYCGAGSEKLLRFYDKAVEKRNVMAFSLNWLAILMLPAWLGYRKQWALWATLAVLGAIIPFIEGLFGLDIPRTSLTAGTLAISFMANGLLLMSANSHFVKLKKSGMDTEQIQGALHNRASSSVSSAFIGAISFIVIQLGSAIIASMFWALPV
jgi:hypothetical protein